MLSYSIAMQATTSTAIMNMAPLMSTKIKEFTENTGNVVTASAQSRQQRAQQQVSGGGGARNK
jgi:hypothetical protein